VRLFARSGKVPCPLEQFRVIGKQDTTDTSGYQPIAVEAMGALSSKQTTISGSSPGCECLSSIFSQW